MKENREMGEIHILFLLFINNKYLFYLVSKYLERESYDGVTKCNKTQLNFHETQTVVNLIQRMKRFLKREAKIKTFFLNILMAGSQANEIFCRVELCWFRILVWGPSDQQINIFADAATEVENETLSFSIHKILLINLSLQTLNWPILCYVNWSF